MSELLNLTEDQVESSLPLVTQEIGALSVTNFDPRADELGTVDEVTLGSTGWVRDGERYERGD